MVLIPSDSRIQGPGYYSSDCQSQITLVAGMKKPYRLQQQRVEDRFNNDANRFQENARLRSLDYSGYSGDSTLGSPSYSHYGPDTKNPGESETAETEVQPICPIPGESLIPRHSEAVLRRGLQIPTRTSYITSGFRLPSVLCDAGVDRARWRAFTMEVKGCGSMSKSQWASVMGCSYGVGLLANFFLFPYGQLVVAPVYAYKRQRDKESENFNVSFASGGLQLVAEKWNRILFEPLGLQIRIEPPNYFGARDMSTMDVSSTKLFRHQEKKGVYSSSTGALSMSADKKEVRYAGKEGKYRTKAARKGRILVFSIQPESTLAEIDAPATTVAEGDWSVAPKAKGDQPAAVSSKGDVGQLDGGWTSRTRGGQEKND